MRAHPKSEAYLAKAMSPSARAGISVSAESESQDPYRLGLYGPVPFASKKVLAGKWRPTFALALDRQKAGRHKGSQISGLR